jgi:hypothetical protein
MDAWNDMGWPARITLLLCLAPLVAAVWYAIRPTARRLALTKAFSVAALYAGLGATAFGMAALLRTIGNQPQLGSSDWSWMATGFGERLFIPSVALGSLAITWLLVAAGIGRTTNQA